jgi:hypothetical protein
VGIWQITAVEMESALAVAAEKLVASGMSEAKAVEYVKSHMNDIVAWALRLIMASK